jgi:hypothetical protein
MHLLQNFRYFRWFSEALSGVKITCLSETPLALSFLLSEYRRVPSY